MPAVNITLGKRSFQMACAAGEEERLHTLAASVNDRIGELESQVGSTNETVLLAMTCLMLQDELQDAKKGIAPAAAEPQGHSDAEMIEALDAVSEYVENITKRVEGL